MGCMSDLPANTDTANVLESNTKPDPEAIRSYWSHRSLWIEQECAGECLRQRFLPQLHPETSENVA